MPLAARKGKHVRVFISSRATHYHALAFFNRLSMTHHFDLPARHPGSNTMRPLCVCMCVCVRKQACVRVCVSCSN